MARQDHGGAHSEAGRVSLSLMLPPKGRILGDFTITCLSDTQFQLTASYGAQDMYWRWFDTHRQEGAFKIPDRRTGFQIAGPKARALLGAVTRQMSRPRLSAFWTPNPCRSALSPLWCSGSATPEISAMKSMWMPLINAPGTGCEPGTPWA